MDKLDWYCLLTFFLLTQILLVNFVYSFIDMNERYLRGMIYNSYLVPFIALIGAAFLTKRPPCAIVSIIALALAIWGVYLVNDNINKSCKSK